ncbi:MAG: TRAP transporter substrate-binding protein, partial [Planctomycetota bacterium]|nr:TRAP transporter substrate-binding protein [Planctomycetota bacterium]
MGINLRAASALLAALSAFALPGTVAAGQKIMRVGIGVPESHFEYKAFVKFKEHVEGKTGGGIEVQLYPSTQLGDDKEVLDAIKIGTAHMNPAGPGVVANFVREMSLISLPYIFPTQEIADRVMDGPWGQKLLKTLERAGFKGLGYGDFGYRHVTNNRRPIAR